MARRRWIADEVISVDRAALTGEHAAHLTRVLRARVGQQFDIAISDSATGNIAAENIVRRGEIVQLSDERVEFELFEEVAAAGALPVTLALAIFKFDRMEWAIEKATEIGVARVLPVVGRRTDTHLAVAAAKRVERWRRIAMEASEQSQRLSPPEILTPVNFKQLVAMDLPLRILLDETETSETLLRVLERAKPVSNILLAVGPEGGWSDEELAAFRKSQWTAVTLGPTILRTETAAIAALAVVASAIHGIEL